MRSVAVLGDRSPLTVVADLYHRHLGGEKVCPESHTDGDAASPLAQPGWHTQGTEDNVMAAYAALLLGVLVKDNDPNEADVRRLLGPSALELLAGLLTEFVQFQTMMGLTTVQQSFTEVIAYLTSRISGTGA